MNTKYIALGLLIITPLSTIAPFIKGEREDDEPVKTSNNFNYSLVSQEQVGTASSVSGTTVLPPFGRAL